MIASHALKLCGAAEDISDLAQESAKCVKLCQTGLSRQKADRLSITKPDRYLGAFAELTAGRIRRAQSKSRFGFRRLLVWLRLDDFFLEGHESFFELLDCPAKRRARLLFCGCIEERKRRSGREAGVVLGEQVSRARGGHGRDKPLHRPNRKARAKQYD